MTRGKNKKSGIVGEDVKIAVSLTLKKFRITDDQKELEFPSSLSSSERSFAHQLARTMGLKSKSRGKGANRYLTVFKKDGSTIVQADAVFQMVRASRQHVLALLQRFPVTSKERQDLMPLSERDRFIADDVGRDMNRTTGRLNNGIPQIPPPHGHSRYTCQREGLPIWPMRDEIVSLVDKHQVVMIAGETGSGKTTQVAQFLLDASHARGRPIRIICTQPRRIAALTNAERVSAERDEKVGLTVGYQIRLESRVSPKTLLTFCTNGVLLRTLMGGDAALATVTHIIVDEVHERDRFSDFLLIILRDALAKFRNVKLILMSAAIDVQLFLKYFNGCPIITVPGKMYQVQEFFLEDVLKCTGYMTKAMLKYKAELGKKQKQKAALNDWCLRALKSPSSRGIDINAGKAIQRNGDEGVAQLDDQIMEAWLSGSEDSFEKLLCIIMNDNVTVDHPHSETGVTPLMVAAGRGYPATVEQLLNLGANVDVRASNNWTALDWARNFNRNDVVEVLEAHMTACESAYSNMTDLLDKVECKDIGEEEKQLLEIYHQTFDDEFVDIDLILCLIYKISSCQEDGAILVFLPGYEEIVKIRDRIHGDDSGFMESSKYVIFTLHSSMVSFDQRQVFHPAPHGARKIILATNIAETSVTFNDVVFVINAGKVKEKSFDAITGSTSLKSMWISKASSLQRRGRAGRVSPGVCYHLFSRIRHKSMQEFQQPEILRVPLHDLCLHAKLLTAPNTPIADFLARAPDPPPFLVTRSAVHLLKAIDALDPWEGLTELGHHLLDLPLDPRLGKMVLYSVILKCLDPILTIVCALAHRDPFVLPTYLCDKKLASSNRKKLSASTFSDHMALLRAFQAWQKACSDGWEKVFCEKNFLSSSSMEMIVGMRTQLLGQLRASGFVRARGGGDIRDLNTNSENWAVVKAALVAGTYPNLIRVDRDRMKLITQKESKIRFHPSSVLAEVQISPKTTVAAAHTKSIQSLPSDWLIYEEMTRTEHLTYVRCCTLVSPITVVLFAGPTRLPLDAFLEGGDNASATGGCPSDSLYGDESDSELDDGGDTNGTTQKAILKLDDWISFRVDSEAAHLALQLRQKWNSLFLRRIRSPGKPWSQVDEAVVRTVIQIVSLEEQSLGLQQPYGVGQRPRPVSSEYFSYPSAGARHASMNMENSSDPSNNSATFAPRLQCKALPKTPKMGQRAVSLTGGQKGSDERSDSSSVRSVGSACGSSPRTTPSQSPTPLANSHPIKYFVIKANSVSAIEGSMSRGVWFFSQVTERHLQRCLQDGKTVCLIFSVQGSGHFEGYAYLTPEIVQDNLSDATMPNFGQAYKIEWVKRANVPFQSTAHNPWKTVRDGQELESTMGEALCQLLDKVPPFTPKTSGVTFSLNKFTAGQPVDFDVQQQQQHHYPHAGRQPQMQHFVGRPIRGHQHHENQNNHYSSSHGMSTSAPSAFSGATARFLGGNQEAPSWSHQQMSTFSPLSK